MWTEVSINQTLKQVERKFNQAESMPVLSFISTPVRIVAGKVQALAGLILASIASIALLFSKNSEKWKNLKRIGQDQMLHGALNVLRGIGVAALTIATLSLGNVVLYMLQQINDFNPIEPYRHTESETPSWAYNSW